MQTEKKYILGANHARDDDDPALKCELPGFYYLIALLILLSSAHPLVYFTSFSRFVKQEKKIILNEKLLFGSYPRNYGEWNFY